MDRNLIAESHRLFPKPQLCLDCEERYKVFQGPDFCSKDKALLNEYVVKRFNWLDKQLKGQNESI